MATGDERTHPVDDYQFPPPGVRIDANDLIQFERVRHEHQLAPKNPSSAPPQFQSKEIVIECRICSRHYESVRLAVSHALHDDKHRKRYKAKQSEAKLKKVSAKDLSPMHIDSLTKLLEAVYAEHAAECQESPNLRVTVYEELKGLVQSIMPDVTVELFGSSLSGFALKESDVNINLNYPAQEDEKTNSRIPSVLKAAMRALVSQPDVYESVEPAFYEFIPSIRCRHLQSGLQLDIRAGQHGPAVEINALLKVYGAIDRRVKVLGVAFRYWAKVCMLDDKESGLYPSLMFVAMVVYFLQQKARPVLPVLHELVDKKDDSPMEDDMNAEAVSAECDSHYFDDLSSLHLRWESESKESLGLLWFQLLRFYTVEFDARERVISLKQRNVMERGKEWPGNRLALEHPFMNRYDLAKAVASQPAHDYMKACLRHALTYFCILPFESKSQPSTQKPQLPAPVHPASGDTVPPVSGDTVPPASGDTVPPATGDTVPPATGDTVPPASGDTVPPASGDTVPPASGDTVPPASGDTVPPASGDTVPPASGDTVPPTSGDTVPPASGDTVHPTSGDTVPGCESVEDMEVVECPSESLVGAEMEDDAPEQSAVERGDDSGEASVGGKVAVGQEGCKRKQASSARLSFAEYRKYVKENRPVCCTFCKQDGHRPEKCPNDISRNKPDTRCTLEPHLKNYVDNLIRSYVDRHGLHTRGTKARERMKEDILKDILTLYPKAALHIFGSSGNGFGAENCDLDLCLLLPGADTHEDKGKIIANLAEMMKRHPDRKYNRIVPIRSARVPIVKFHFTPKSTDWYTECDISLGNSLAVHNTRMLAAYARVDERVKLLGHAFKCLMKNCGVADASQGSFSSYAYILMVIHFLQRTSPPVVPVLQLLPEEGHVREIAGWNCYFYDFDGPNELMKVWPQLGSNKAGVVDLWIEMLRYYAGTFNWHKHVVCIRRDPKENHLDKFDKMWMSKAACVEDPFDLSHNLGTVVSVRMFKFIHNVLVNVANFFGAGGKHQLTLKNMCEKGRVEYWSELLDRDVLTDSKKAPVDPKFWDRVNRGEETDNPPFKDKAPLPNKRRSKDGRKGMAKQDMGSRGRPQDVPPKAAPAAHQQQKPQHVQATGHAVSTTAAPQVGVHPGGSRAPLMTSPPHSQGMMPFHGAPQSPNQPPPFLEMQRSPPAVWSPNVPAYLLERGSQIPLHPHHMGGGSPAYPRSPLQPTPLHAYSEVRLLPLPGTQAGNSPIFNSQGVSHTNLLPVFHGYPMAEGPGTPHEMIPNTQRPPAPASPMEVSSQGSVLGEPRQQQQQVPTAGQLSASSPVITAHPEAVQQPSAQSTNSARMKASYSEHMLPQPRQHSRGRRQQRHRDKKHHPNVGRQGQQQQQQPEFPRQSAGTETQAVQAKKQATVAERQALQGERQAATVERQAMKQAAVAERQAVQVERQAGVERKAMKQAEVAERQAVQVERQAGVERQAMKQAAVAERQAAKVKRHAVEVEKQAIRPERQAVVPERQAVVPERQAVVSERQAVVPERQAVVPERQAVVAERLSVNSGQCPPGNIEGNARFRESKPGRVRQPGNRVEHQQGTSRGRGRGGRGRGQRGRRE